VKSTLLKDNKEVLLLIGSFSLIISILLNLFAGAIPILDFLKGLFTGISLVSNLGYLFKLRVDKKRINIKKELMKK
jgi:hypothetical protein